MTSVHIPGTGSYLLANAHVPRSLTPGLAASFDSDGFAQADIAVASAGGQAASRWPTAR